MNVSFGDLTGPVVSEETARVAVEFCPNGMIMTDRHGKIMLVNGEVERLFGYRREELQGKSIDILVPPAVREVHRRQRTVFAKSPQARRMGAGRDLRGVRKDGTEVPVEIGLSLLRTDNGPMILSAITDATERKTADERLRLAVEACPSGMIATDADGNIVLVNAEAERMFGYEHDELLGRSIDILVPAPLRTKHREHLTAFVEQRQSRRMGVGRDLHGSRKDGTQIPVEIGLTSIPTRSGLMIVSAITDITERRRAEAQVRRLRRRSAEHEHALEEKEEAEAAARKTAAACHSIEAVNRQLEEFAYAASHDLKAPLRVIDNASKWLEEDLHQHLTAEARENMNLLRGRVGRMERLLDDLLKYSRLRRTADREPAEVVSGDVLMDNVRALLAPPAGFAVKAGSGFADIRVQSMPLQEILLQLIGSAIKHHDKNDGCIEATVEDCGAYYAFAVSDDGPGILAQLHDQIFDTSQARKHEDRSVGGGIGLAMVRENIEACGGTLELDSIVGRGSVFRFTWPKQ